jgi:hypothetical protein
MRACFLYLALFSCLAGLPAAAQELPLATNLLNFRMKGTQPGGLTTSLAASSLCAGCHGNTSPIFNDWTGSLMAQAARDPIFYACLDIAEADAPGSGDLCIRCHVPKAWLEGRSTPTSGSAITAADRDGINCAFCHRLVDPYNTLGDAPPADASILAALGANSPVQCMDRGSPSLPGNNGNGSYVVDPDDQRRGPFPLPPDTMTPPVWPEADCLLYHDPVPTFESPFHRRSDICATCHDVSLPHFNYNMAGTALVFNGTGVQHPTSNKYDMTPVERTYSEWLRSEFAQGLGVDMNGRFGGPGQTYVSSCQDCHMPFADAQGCFLVASTRPDLPHHTLSGAATWVLDAIGQQYGPSGTGELTAAKVSQLSANKARNIDMLQRAADLSAVLDDSQTPGIKQLRVRVTNQTGHKLPSGYPEGRRVWLTVQFFACDDYTNPMHQYGAYDPATAVLDDASTKVYEMKAGMDDDLAAALNRTAGPSHHFVLTNKIYKDNRIPPRGFDNDRFAAVQAAPVASSYANGQYWDDTFFNIPAYAVGARVILYYQSTSREYIEFLRDRNPFPGDPNNRGMIAYNLWVANGKGAPVPMATLGSPTLLDVELKGDMDGDRRVLPGDIPDFVSVLLGELTAPRLICAADVDDSGAADSGDIPGLISRLLAP